MNADRIEAVAALLQEAEAAHGTYEADVLNGAYDEAWPGWYAGFAVAHGLPGILASEIRAERLAQVLRTSFEDFKRLEPPTLDAWATYAARRIVDEAAATG